MKKFGSVDVVNLVKLKKNFIDDSLVSPSLVCTLLFYPSVYHLSLSSFSPFHRWQNLTPTLLFVSLGLSSLTSILLAFAYGKYRSTTLYFITLPHVGLSLTATTLRAFGFIEGLKMNFGTTQIASFLLSYTECC